MINRVLGTNSSSRRRKGESRQKRMMKIRKVVDWIAILR